MREPPRRKVKQEACPKTSPTPQAQIEESEKGLDINSFLQNHSERLPMRSIATRNRELYVFIPKP